MAMTVRVMEIISKAKAEVGKIKEEQLAVEKRLEQFNRRVEQIQKEHQAHLDRLGLSQEELADRVRKNELHRDGIEMFVSGVSGGPDSLPESLTHILSGRDQAQVKDQDPVQAQGQESCGQSETPPRVKKRRLRINL